MNEQILGVTAELKKTCYVRLLMKQSQVFKTWNKQYSS